LISFIKKLGPGILFAGAAIGVSHLILATKAGAEYGFGLLWALLLIHAVKYPFFEFGSRYALATGKSLVDGYATLGKPVLWTYTLLTFTTMFTIQTAVTIVTAGIAMAVFNWGSIQTWIFIILLLCGLILVFGKYKTLDKIIKGIVLLLTFCTCLVVCFAFQESTSISWTQTLAKNPVEVGFLIAFMGWMPAPLDLSVWQSIWTIKKKKTETIKQSNVLKMDFNIGYATTLILAISFMALGAFSMFETGSVFSSKSSEFAIQLISLYSTHLGADIGLIVGIAALATMLSTTLTTLDASPRVMQQSVNKLFSKQSTYLFWILILIIGTLVIFIGLQSEMALFVKIATILSFITAPFYAICNYKLVTQKSFPQNNKPSSYYQTFSIIAILFLIAFSFWYLYTLTM